MSCQATGARTRPQTIRPWRSWHLRNAPPFTFARAKGPKRASTVAEFLDGTSGCLTPISPTTRASICRCSQSPNRKNRKGGARAWRSSWWYWGSITEGQSPGSRCGMKDGPKAAQRNGHGIGTGIRTITIGHGSGTSGRAGNGNVVSTSVVAEIPTRWGASAVADR